MPHLSPRNVHYRAATLADVVEMARCRLADPAAGPADPRMAAYLEGKHHPRRALTARIAYVALVAGRVVGYVAGHLTRRYECEGEVQYLFVDPSHRRVGVASQLLRELAGWFTERGAARICVDVEPGNASARAFYKRYGAIELQPSWLVWNDIRSVGAGAA